MFLFQTSKANREAESPLDNPGNRKFNHPFIRKGNILRRKPRQPRHNTENREERPGMEGTQFLYCETRKGSPRVNIEVCLTKCKKAKKCKPLEEYHLTGRLENVTDPNLYEVDSDDRLHTAPDPEPPTPTIDDLTDSDRFENFIDQEFDKERKADPNHPINRRGNEQLDLFNFQTTQKGRTHK